MCSYVGPLLQDQATDENEFGESCGKQTGSHVKVMETNLILSLHCACVFMTVQLSPWLHGKWSHVGQQNSLSAN